MTDQQANPAERPANPAEHPASPTDQQANPAEYPASPAEQRASPAEPPAGPGIDQTANLLGALSLVLTDRVADAMGEAGGRPESAAAALSALLHFLDRPTVDRLRQVLGLTSSGTVRLVDRMTESGYVQRGPGRDGRSTTVTLTEAGLAAAERVATARAEVLEGALAGLTDADRDALRRIVGTMLAGLIRGPGATRWICRLCDTGACRGAKGGCPVGNAARERYVSDPELPGKSGVWPTWAGGGGAARPR